MAEESKTKYIGGGTSLYTLLTVAFIVLKLCNVITWSWWLVLAPLWIPISLVAIILLILILIYICLS